MPVKFRNDENVPAAIRSEVERLCGQFENAWKSGQPAELELILADASAPARESLLVELLKIDVEYRRRSSQSPNVSEYLSRLPSYEKVIRSVFFALGQTQGIDDCEPDAGRTSSDPRPNETIQVAGLKVLGKIGAGGMGAVYRVEDEKFKRQLAIKVLGSAYAGVPAAEARFLAEAQLTGRLQHPGIPPVHDLGRLGDGRPYFTMKLIDGRTLAELLAQRSSPQAELHRYLNVFEQVAQTLAYAHAQEVIHRDLKPLNVMVGAFGEVQLMDWGLARVGRVRQVTGSSPSKVAPHAGSSNQSTVDPAQVLVSTASLSAAHSTDRSSIAGEGEQDDHRTRPGAVMGTYAYLPPEQARGRIEQLDERSDVFGLGAMLCEILTGKPPYIGWGGKSPFEQALSADLTDAFARMESCGADEQLLWLAKDCLAEIPSDRPRDAAVVAQRIRSHLSTVQERLEQARADKAAADIKAVEERRRRRISAALAVSLFVGAIALVVGLLVVSSKNEALASANQRIKSQNTDLEKSRTLERAARVKAEKKTEEAEIARTHEATARHQAESTLGYLVRAFRSPDPRVDGRTITVADLLDRASEELKVEFSDNPRTKWKLLYAIGQAYHGLGLYDQAIASFADARELCAQDLGADDSQTITLINDLATAHLNAGQLTESVQLFELALQLRKQTVGDEDAQTFNAMNNLGNAYDMVGRTVEAKRIFEETLKLRMEHLGAKHPSTLTSAHNLAHVYQKTGRLKDAIRMFEENLRMRSELFGAEDVDTIQVMDSLANAYHKDQRSQQAIELLEKLVELRKAKFGPEHPGTAASIASLAQCYAAAGRLKEAVPMLEKSVALLKRKLRDQHPYVISSSNNLAYAYLRQGRVRDAIPIFEFTYHAQLDAYGPDNADTLNSQSALGEGYFAVGRLDEAIPLLEQAVRRLKVTAGMEDRDTLKAINRLTNCYFVASRYGDAIPLLKQSLEIQKSIDGPTNANTLMTMYNLGAAYEESGDMQEAIELFEKTWDLRKTELGVGHPDTLLVLNDLARSYQKAGRLPEAIPLFEESVRLRIIHTGADHPDTMIAKNNLGGAYMAANRIEDAMPLLEETYAHRRDHLGNDNPEVIQSLGNLAMLSLKASQPEKATSRFNEFVEKMRPRMGAKNPAFAGLLAQISFELVQHQQYALAETYLQECLSIRQEAIPDDWRFPNTKCMLGVALAGQKKFAEAEPLLLEGYDGLKQRKETIPPDALNNITLAIQGLIDLYTAWEKADEVAKWSEVLSAAEGKSPAEGNMSDATTQ